MRCPSCTKFVSLEFQEPECEDIRLDDGNITATVRLVRACAECGDELKEATLEMEEDRSSDVEEHLEGCEKFQARLAKEREEAGLPSKGSFFGAEVSYTLRAPPVEGKPMPEENLLAEADVEVSEDGVEQLEEGGGRYKKSFFGAEVSYTLHCNDCNQDICSGSVSDKVAASEMEEMV